MSYTPSLYSRCLIGGVVLVLAQGLLLLLLLDLTAAGRGALLGVSLLLILLLPLAIRAILRPLYEVVSALEVGVNCFKDNDYSVTIENNRYKELALLVDSYNELSARLRDERMTIFQRELLLDTVIQSTPESLILTNGRGIIVYSNMAARTLLNHKGRLDGLRFADLLQGMPPEILAATKARQSGLVTEKRDGAQIVYDLHCKEFTLNNQTHHLYLYKNLTSEMSVKENDIWKQVIRLISHELNNSLAPISSLTNSAKQILDEPEHHQLLPDIFDTITRRTQNLHQFIDQYATFARLPKPNKQQVALRPFVDGIARVCEVPLDITLARDTADFDPVQVEQVLINLIKNAKESGSDLEAILLAVMQQGDKLVFEVSDGGPGMSGSQLQQALLPFFTTKAEGTGLGLALCNEIVLAHGGRLNLHNRQPRGLSVKFSLPLAA